MSPDFTALQKLGISVQDSLLVTRNGVIRLRDIQRVEVDSSDTLLAWLVSATHFSTDRYRLVAHGPFDQAVLAETTAGVTFVWRWGWRSKWRDEVRPIYYAARDTIAALLAES